MGDDSWAHGVAFFVDQMVFGRGRWGQRFVWDEGLGTTSVRNFNTMIGNFNTKQNEQNIFGRDAIKNQLNWWSVSQETSRSF